MSTSDTVIGWINVYYDHQGLDLLDGTYPVLEMGPPHGRDVVVTYRGHDNKEYVEAHLERFTFKKRSQALLALIKDREIVVNSMRKSLVAQEGDLAKLQHEWRKAVVEEG